MPRSVTIRPESCVPPGGDRSCATVPKANAGWARPSDLAAARNISKSRAYQLVRNLPDHAKGKINGCLHFDTRYLAGSALDISKANRPEPPTELASQADTQRDALVRRIIDDADTHAADLAAHGLKGQTKADAIFCHQRGQTYYALAFTDRTLRRWRKAVANGKALPEGRGRKHGAHIASIGPDAWSFFVATALKLKLPVAEAFRITLGKCAEQAGGPGWSWSASYPTVLRRLAREFPDFYREYVTLDPEKWAARNMPKMDRRQNDLPAGLVWEVDGTPANVMCRNGDKQCRPQVIVTACPASRKVLGVSVGISESTELIRRSMCRAYDCEGAAKTVRIDQGKAFGGQGIGDLKRRKAKADQREVVGLIKAMGAEIHDTTGRSPWQKGFIESVMRAVDKHDHLYKSYVGNRTANRSRLTDGWIRKHTHKLPTIGEYEQTLQAFFDAENLTPRKTLDGLSPEQKFRDSCKEHFIARRAVAKHAEVFLRRRPQRVKATTKGAVVTIGGVRLHFGHRDPRLWERRGQELIAYIDENDTSNVLLCQPDGKPLFYAANDGLIGTDAESIREAGKAQRKARKRARDRFKDIDLAAAPTVDVALEYKRKAAELLSAEANQDVPKRPTTVLYTPFDDELLEAHQEELRKAVGAEELSPLSLRDVVGQANSDALDGVGGMSLADLNFETAMEGTHDDPIKYFET